MCDLSSPMRGWTCVPCTARQILNHWTTREVPLTVHFYKAKCFSSRVQKVSAKIIHTDVLLHLFLEFYSFRVFINTLNWVNVCVKFELCFKAHISVFGNWIVSALFTERLLSWLAFAPLSKSFYFIRIDVFLVFLVCFTDLSFH